MPIFGEENFFSPLVFAKRYYFVPKTFFFASDDNCNQQREPWEGQILIDIMNDHGLEQMVHFPTREKNTLDLILTTLPGQFQDVHSPDKLSDHDIVSGTLKIFTPTIKKPRRKVYLYQKGDYKSMRKDTLEFTKE